jgi:hypothetical protein
MDPPKFNEEQKENDILRQSAKEAYKDIIKSPDDIVKRDWNPATFPKYQLPDYLKYDPVLFQFFKRVHYDDKNFIAVVVGETGCQPAGSKVLMATGEWKNVEDIVGGDKIVGPSPFGKRKKAMVRSITAFATGNVYGIFNTKNKLLYKCSAKHKIPVDIETSTYKKYDAIELYKKKKPFWTYMFINGSIFFVLCHIKKLKRTKVYGIELNTKEQLYVTDNNMITGNSGKSITALNLARSIDITPLGDGRFKRNFHIKALPNGKADPQTRIVFTPSDFLKLAKSGLPKGSIIVWDEAGVGQDATKWNDKKSRLIKHVFQTFRSRNYGLFMTVPDKESITLSTRRLVHCYIDVTKRDATHAYLDIRWLNRIRGNEKTETYYKYPVFKDPVSGKLKKIVRYKVPKIDSTIEREYNKIKDVTLQDLYNNYQREMEFMERELGEASSVAPAMAIKLKKFNMSACAEVVKSKLDDIKNDDLSISNAKIMLVLSKSGYECNSAQAKLVAEIARGYDSVGIV